MIFIVQNDCGEDIVTEVIISSGEILGYNKIERGVAFYAIK